MNLSKNLKRILFERSLKAADLARLSGVSKTSIGEWLSGSNPRDIRKVKKVADVLEVSLDNLCFGDGSLKRSDIEDYKDQIEVGTYDVILKRVKK